MSANPYNPVTTTDTTQLADDDWGLNLPNIRYTKNYGRSPFKGVCNLIRERIRCFIVFACVFTLAIVLISIIAVATSKKSGRRPTDKDREEHWSSPEEGLVFYPVPLDGSKVITFSLADLPKSPLLESLDNATEVYKASNQKDEWYKTCTEHLHPVDRTCKFDIRHLGDVCTHDNGYGYRHAAPCIFLQLNLPVNVSIKPISRESLLWPVADIIMQDHNDSAFVPVHCEGTTKKDKLILGVHGFDKSDPSPIQYYPPEGLPSFYYRPRHMSLPFIKPAMMLHLTSLKDDLMVHITCTAWGQLFDENDKAIDHKLLKTHFAVYMRIH